MKLLIVNGDDFGASQGINRGIIEAHDRGILTSTSLLVGAPASPAAAEIGRATPRLSVGLHVDLPAAPGANDDERLVRESLRAQLARFHALMGRPPTHLDSHHDVHRDPRWLPLFRELADEHTMPLRGQSTVRLLSKFYGRWAGESHPEQISTTNLVQLLSREVEDGVTELCCHPGYVDPQFSTGYSAEREVELRTLCDPILPRVLRTLSIRLLSYHELDRLGPLSR